MTLQKSDTNTKAKVIEVLKAGGVCVLPTDTVYGFSSVCDIKGEKALHTAQKIRQIKFRDKAKPFIHLLASPEDVMRYSAQSIPAKLLALWPGSLTIIVPIKEDILLDTSINTAAFRCPKDDWLRQIIEASNRPLYSTSVNISGQKPCETIKDIEKNFSLKVDLIVDSGDAIGKLPSTIVSLHGENIMLLRQGSVKIPHDLH